MSEKSAPAVESIRTNAGAVKIGMTWDQALPVLRTGERLGTPQYETRDRFVETRKWKRAYRVTFERPTPPKLGPYRIVRIETAVGGHDATLG